MNRHKIVNSQRLDIQAQSALRGLFRGKLIEASMFDGKIMMEAQLGIKKLEYAIIEFIESKSYSSFKIYQNDDSVMIQVKNYKSLPEDTDVHKYEIVVDPTWQNATIFQASVGGTMTKQRRIINDD